MRSLTNCIIVLAFFVPTCFSIQNHRLICIYLSQTLSLFSIYLSMVYLSLLLYVFFNLFSSSHPQWSLPLTLNFEYVCVWVWYVCVWVWYVCGMCVCEFVCVCARWYVCVSICKCVCVFVRGSTYICLLIYNLF